MFVAGTLLMFVIAGQVHAQQQTRRDSAAYVASLDAAAYRFEDSTGNAHTLKEYAGKYVYLDIWASWCYPCRKEYPFLKELMGKVDANTVKVLSVSIDRTKFRWIGALQGYQMTEGTQWVVTDTTFERAFDIDRIPRFILLDKQGKVLQYSMSRPSHAETLEYLNKLK
ncbi:thioredoxin family protein [Filimonas lacunae]|nr:thioredoxin family protein [Filimonas lacunae]